MTLYAAYVPLMNFLARLFGAIAFVVGAFGLAPRLLPVTMDRNGVVRRRPAQGGSRES